MKNIKMKRTYGFTLAEILIALAIIGIIAAITIPSVISNAQQQEFKTGLRKAVSVLNSAIAMGSSQEGVTPYDLTKDYTLFEYLTKHMSIMKSTTDLSTIYYAKQPYLKNSSGYITNKVFYTTDGMRYEMYSSSGSSYTTLVTHEFGVRLNFCYGYDSCVPGGYSYGFNCGSYGLGHNPYDTQRAPCLITVDVNGDRKPNPDNVNCHSYECAKNYKISDVYGLKLTDLFSIMITADSAIPYGVAAQRAMYQARK